MFDWESLLNLHIDTNVVMKLTPHPPKKIKEKKYWNVFKISEYSNSVFSFF